MLIMPKPFHLEKIFSILEKEHHSTMLELLKEYTPFQLLVATLLSSRTKDSTTIPLVKKIFQHCPTPQHFLNIPLQELEKALYGIGFYRVKARNVQKLSRIILETYQGRVPSTREELTSLPGVGRKTANCLLAYCFHQPAIAVDIHVHRIANRLGWIQTTTPEESEQALQKIIPIARWRDVNKLLVDHGQRICLPRGPKCLICPVKRWCEYGQKMENA